MVIALVYLLLTIAAGFVPSPVHASTHAAVHASAQVAVHASTDDPVPSFRVPDASPPAHLVCIDADYREVIGQAWLDRVEILLIGQDYLIVRVDDARLGDLPAGSVLESGAPPARAYLGVELDSPVGRMSAEQLGDVVFARGNQLVVRQRSTGADDDFRPVGIRAATRLQPIRLRPPASDRRQSSPGPAWQPPAEPPTPETLRDDIVADIVAAVSEVEYHLTIQDLEDFATRSARGATFPTACAHAHDVFEYYGLNAEIEEFMAYPLYGSPFTCWNVVAEKVGGVYPDQVYVICGHLDATVGDPAHAEPLAPGADDNASGTAAVLEVARIMSFFDFKYTVRFICFGAEEQGLCGSHAYAATAASLGDDIVGVINLDMLLYSPFNYDTIRITYNLQSQPLAELFEHTARLYVPDLIVLLNHNPGAANSDHWPFWVHGYEAILGIEDLVSSNPYYHQTTDLLANYMDYFPFGTNCVRGAIAALAFLAQPLGGVGVDDGAGRAPAAAGLTILDVSPNPVQDLARVTFSSGTEERVTLTLFDMAGRAVWRQGEMVRPLRLPGVELDLGDLSSGVYLLHAQGTGVPAVRAVRSDSAIGLLTPAEVLLDLSLCSLDH